MINGKYALHKKKILQDFYYNLLPQQSNKALALAEFLENLPTGVADPPLHDDLPDEHVFTISLDDPWYGRYSSLFWACKSNETFPFIKVIYDFQVLMTGLDD